MPDTALINVRLRQSVRKSRLWARAAYHYGRRRLLGRRTPTALNIAYDYRCNLRCEHCFAEALKPPPGPRLTIDDVARVADQAAALGCLFIGFQGGEPTLWRELPDLIRATDPGRFLIGIYTNATLLDPAMLAELRTAGLDLVNLSLDSGVASEHDHFRGRDGCYDQVIEGITLAREAGLQVKLCTTVCHGAVFTDGFRELIALAERERLPTCLLIATPAGNYAGREDVLLDERELAHVEALCARNKLFYRDIHRHLGHTGCKAVDQLYLTQDGEVMPCPFIHLSLGNVLSEPLDAIFARGAALPWFREAAPICLAGEPGPFMDDVMSRTWNAPRLPLPVEEVLELAEQADTAGWRPVR